MMKTFSKNQWYSPSEFIAACPDLSIQEWLLFAGSLTKRLRFFDADVQIELLANGPIMEDKDRHYAWCREVLIHGHHRNWIYASTLLTEKGMNGVFKPVKNLGSTPLGDFLFSQPGLHRSEYTVAYLSEGHEYVRASQKDNITEPLWGRRSYFTLEGSSLLLTEIFLPGFWALRDGHLRDFALRWHDNSTE